MKGDVKRNTSVLTGRGDKEMLVAASPLTVGTIVDTAS
jgi:hypothetical protein